MIILLRRTTPIRRHNILEIILIDITIPPIKGARPTLHTPRPNPNQRARGTIRRIEAPVGVKSAENPGVVLLGAETAAEIDAFPVVAAVAFDDEVVALAGVACVPRDGPFGRFAGSCGGGFGGSFG